MLLEGCYLCSTWGSISKRKEGRVEIVLQENYCNLCFVSLPCLGFALVLTFQSQGRSSCVISEHKTGVSPLPRNYHIIEPTYYTQRHEQTGINPLFWICNSIQASMTDHANLRPLLSNRESFQTWRFFINATFVWPFQQLAHKHILDFTIYCLFQWFHLTGLDLNIPPWQDQPRTMFTFIYLHLTPISQKKKSKWPRLSCWVSGSHFTHSLLPGLAAETWTKLDASPLTSMKLTGKQKGSQIKMTVQLLTTVWCLPICLHQT